MPGGRGTLHQYLREKEHASSEMPKRKGGKGAGRAKDHVYEHAWAYQQQLLAQMDLDEYHILRAAGARTRRRLVNERQLRDLAGPMTADDMEGQFKPVPFGVPRLSPLAQAMQSGAWEHFRAVDPDRERRVLEKWEEHNRSLKQASSSTSSSPAAAHAPAAQAVSRWGRVGKKARQALRRANVSAVMDLELQLLDFLQRPGAASGGEQLSMPMEDGFGRLLVHGLAEFHGLLAAHKAAAGDEPAVVVVYAHRRPPRASAGGHASGDEDSGDASHGKLSNTASQARQQPQEDAVAWPRGGDDDVPALGHAAGAVMCCDVLQALQEVGHLGVGHRELIARIALHAGYQHHPHHEPTAAVSLGAAAGGGAAAVVCA